MYLELRKGLQVVCTQPRRVAARGVAERVAVEMDVRLGDQVGVHHRDNNNTNAQTRLKFVTEGILLRQCQGDPLLSRYVSTFLPTPCFTSTNMRGSPVLSSTNVTSAPLTWISCWPSSKRHLATGRD